MSSRPRHREESGSRSRAPSSHSTHSEKPKLPKKSLNPFRKRRPQNDSPSDGIVPHRGDLARDPSRAPTKPSQHSDSQYALVKSVKKFRFIPALVEKSHKQLQQVARTLIELHEGYDPDNKGNKIGKDIQRVVRRVTEAEKLHCDVKDALAKEERSLKKDNHAYQQALATIASEPRGPRRSENELIMEDLEYFWETRKTIEEILKRYKKSEIMKLQHDERRRAASEFIRLLESLNNTNELLIGKVGGTYTVIGGQSGMMLPDEEQEYLRRTNRSH